MRLDGSDHDRLTFREFVEQRRSTLEYDDRRTAIMTASAAERGIGRRAPCRIHCVRLGAVRDEETHDVVPAPERRALFALAR